MPSLSQLQSASIVKLLAFGNSKTRKTTSLVSLVSAGYKLHIMDFDNLLGPLRSAIMRLCPDKIDNVEAYSIRDKYKASITGMIVDGRPSAWTTGLRMLNHWKYDDVDLGIPATWGPDYILVIDSLSRLCDAAYNYHEAVMPRTSKKGTDFDGRAVYGSAQDDVEKQVAMLTSESFATNVIVIGHGAYMKLDDGTTKILPQGVGQKLSPKIPQYFPNIVYYKRGAGNADPTIHLESDSMVDLANDGAERFNTTSLTIESGLAEIFRVLRDQPPTQEPATKPPFKPFPSPITLKRA